MKYVQVSLNISFSFFQYTPNNHEFRQFVVYYVFFIKFSNVFKERNYLNDAVHPEILHDPLTDRLLEVNQALWKVEDLLRDFERASSFGEEFIDLARSVYRLNDKRAHIKKDINSVREILK